MPSITNKIPTTISDPNYLSKRREDRIDQILSEYKEKKIENLKSELSQLKKDHSLSWETYGSELCAGDMFRIEEELENKIKGLENE
jgi:hypothetical protein